ncbi:OsmC family peroxiredoxin [Leucobacter denitrificans]|uniref:OsmC family peroxiredoxin n=1 Tax=Leucobacter denitrificans TaxID=683042 RepID=A0A7G9S3W8_9MICO|nr:OsmC family peroxiredoxin [Leucobacter denitrificans]QNN62543.1 OsmC family peroxiredoxin [Leucobacter denitrificans]
MAIATRTVTTTWDGTLEAGTGTFGDSSSGALDGQQVTWGSRTVAPEGKTSPEELLAAAHSSCFSMALALTLGSHDAPPQRLEISSEVVFEEADGKPTITTSKITVRAKIDGIDGDKFSAIVDEAAALCPVSRLFAGANITVDAQLV